MTTSYGLSASGYLAKNADQYAADLGAAILANVDPGLDLDPSKPLGMIIAMAAARYAALDLVIQTVYQSIDPGQASGDLLRQRAALSGTLSQSATYSTLTAQLQLTANTTVPAGTVCAIAGQPSNTWVLLEDVASLSTDVYTGSPPTTTKTGNFRAANPGPFEASIGTLTIISTPAVGFLSVSNAAAAEVGLAADTDETLRQKRIAELPGEGSGTRPAIRGRVLKVEGILSCTVLENTSLYPNSAGLPGKSFQVILWDGPGAPVSNTEIGNAIVRTKPAGVQSFGSTSVVATDASGNPQTVYFSRVTEVPVYVSCTTTPVASTLSSDQIAAIKSAIKEFADVRFTVGADIVARSFAASPLEAYDADPSHEADAYAPMITDVTSFAFDVHATPTNTANITGSPLQIFTVDTSHITVS